MQELANAIGARLIISPSTDFNTFAIGSTAPASNVGPWLKDCLEWFVFDDSTATYIPENSVSSGGFKTQEYHTASGTFTVPDFIYKLRVQLWGGGGGGGVGGPAPGGGGAGAYGLKIFDVTPGQMIPYTIGAGGASGTPGVAGGSSIFLTMTAGGGSGSLGGANNFGVVGGTAVGGDMNITGQSGDAGNSASGFGGAGGDSPNGGGGGTYINPVNSAMTFGKVPGGAGAGSITGSASGDGAGGAILIEY